MDVDADVSKLQLLKRSFNSNKYKLEMDLQKSLPEKRDNVIILIDKLKRILIFEISLIYMLI